MAMLKGFKDFLMRGNVVDLAVAVVMGAALTALVTSLSDAFINPLIKLVTGGGEVGGKFTVNGVDFPYSTFINGLIIFLLTAAAVYFVIVLPVRKIQERLWGVKEEDEEEQIVLLREIRDLLQAQSNGGTPGNGGTPDDGMPGGGPRIPPLR